MTTCEEVRTALGVYVVGAIEPAERSRVEAHLTSCPVCRDELASMAGLPALLGRVSEQQIAHVAGPPEELLDSLLARAAAERPPSASLRRLWAPLALAAAMVLVAGLVLGGLLMGGGGPHGHQALPEPSESVSAPLTAAEQVAAIDPRTHISAQVAFRSQPWGTALSVRVSGVPGGLRCRLVVVGGDGRQDTAASWRVEAEGYGDFSGSTMIRRQDLRAFKIVTIDGGRTLVTLNVPSHPV